MAWDSSNTNTIINAGANTLSGVWGLIGEKSRENRAFDKNKKLMDIQFRNQMALDKYGQELQLDMWNKTGYPAQVAMLKEAGLNPALLYSKGGTPGTTGSQGGGNAAMGTASQGQPHKYVDLGQSLMEAAQITLMKAQAKKTEAEANVIDKTGLEEAQTRISKMIAETSNETLKSKLIGLETDMMEIEKAYKPYKLLAEIDNILENTKSLKLHNDLTQDQYDDLVKEVHERAIGQQLNNVLTESEIELKKAQVILTNTQKQQIITSLTQKWTELKLQDEKIAIDKFTAEMHAELPSAGQVLGGIAKKAYISLKNIENLITGKELRDIKDIVK